MRFFTVSQLGPKQQLTPEGFLLCSDVPLARIGIQYYSPSEVPIEPGPDGRVTIERRRQDVFAEDTLNSAVGKPFVDEHPEAEGDEWLVNPENWRSLARGHVIDVREGRGADDGVMLGDLLITDGPTIDLIRQKIKTEVSCGYAAKYESSGTAGYGFQTDIIINHVALVSNGRCGSRCSIGDSLPKENQMSWFDKFTAAIKSKDQKAAEAALAEAPNGEKVRFLDGVCDHAGHEGHHGHKVWGDAEEDRMKKVEDAVEETKSDMKEMKDGMKEMRDGMRRVEDSMRKTRDAESEEEKKERERKEREEKETNDAKRMKDAEIEGELEEEAPPGTGDKAKKAKDSEYLSDSFQNTVALAEIITPGVSIPTFDAKCDPKKTLLNVCKFRKQVLDHAYSNDLEVRQFVDEQLRGRSLDSVQTCDAVRSLFMSVGALKKRSNSKTTQSSMTSDLGGFALVGGGKSIADVNKANDEYWKTH